MNDKFQSSLNPFLYHHQEPKFNFRSRTRVLQFSSDFFNVPLLRITCVMSRRIARLRNIRLAQHHWWRLNDKRHRSGRIIRIACDTTTFRDDRKNVNVISHNHCVTKIIRALVFLFFFFFCF